MDHHCAYTQNCIGYKNYSHFYWLLVYGNLACFFSIIKYIYFLYEFYFSSLRPKNLKGKLIIFLVVVFIISIAAFFAQLIGLLIQHTLIATWNSGTIDDLSFANRNIGHFGVITNLHLVFGELINMVYPIYYIDTYEGIV